MRKLIGIVLLVSTLVLAACQPVTVEQATLNYCASLQAFQTASLAVKGLDENSTVDEAQAAFRALETAFQNVLWSSSTLSEAELDALQQSYQDLLNVSREIEGEDTLGEAQATVQASQEAVQAAWDDLYASADCANLLATE
jgi:hypothetical protein